MILRALPLLALTGTLALVACEDYPQLDLPQGAEVERGDYPRLLPLIEILDIDVAPPQIDTELVLTLQQRATRLRARAAALRQSALTQADRSRIRSAVARLAAL